MCQFTLRTLLWLTVVVALLLGFAGSGTFFALCALEVCLIVSFEIGLDRLHDRKEAGRRP